MILNLFLFLAFPLLGSSSKSSSGKLKKIQLDCDVRPFNDLHLLNYFLKQQLKQNPIPNDDLSRKFYSFRDTVDLNQLEEECEKKSRAKFALIKRNNGKNFEVQSSSVNKSVQKNRKKISQRMSLELVNALLLGKLLGLNLGMLSSFLFSSAFKPGRTTPIPGGGNGGGGGGGQEGGGGGAGGGGDQGGGGGGGDAGGGGGDNGRFLNYDDSSFSSRFNDQEREYCDENDDKISDQPIEAPSHDYRDWNYKHHNRKRSKRDLFTGSRRRKQNFISPPEDNEDLWLSSGVPQTPIYIPQIPMNRFGSPDLSNNHIAMHNHKLGLDSLGQPYKPKQGILNRNKENEIPGKHFPTYSFLAPSSFAFPQIPTTVYHYKPKSRGTPSFGTLYGQKGRKARPNLTNLFPNYDSNLDNLATDYQDEMANRKEEIDLEHKEKSAKEPSYFDDEFEDEFNRDDLDRKYPGNRDLEKDFKVNFDKSFDKEFNPKPAKPKKPKNTNKNKNKNKNKRKHRPSIKKMIDTSQVEREGDEEMPKESDANEQKLVRITRQITTVYNKNLFEDSFDLRSVGEKGELLDKEGLLQQKESLLESGQDLLDDSAASLLGGQDLLENADLTEPTNEKRNMPRLKKKRMRKGMKGKRKVSSGGNRKKNRKRAQGKTFPSTNKRRPGKRRGTKSK